jgi:hypothetical protein
VFRGLQLALEGVELVAKVKPLRSVLNQLQLQPDQQERLDW